MNVTVLPQYSWLERFGHLFYIIDYRTTSFKTPDQVPEYHHDIVPLLVSLIVIEHFVSWLQGKGTPRLGAAYTSLGHAILYELKEVFTKGFELMWYDWMYQYRILDFDWDSPVTWWTAVIGVDFLYYWSHRSLHELACLWSIHQVHHASEEFNLSAGMRLTVFEFHRVFFLLLALIGVPLPTVIVHMNFNLLYQFWIHTETIGKLGPLEWIFNTPSHHKVHHGSNPYCLDKNYGGYLIIWDRMFGTFAAEREEEQLVYGLVTQPQTYNVLYLQVFAIKEVFQKCLAQESFGNKLRALFYGPGWFPGTSRLGDPPPEEHLKRSKYDPSLPRWMDIYFAFHVMFIMYIQQLLVHKSMEFSAVTIMMLLGYLLLFVGIGGAVYDGWYWAPLLEASRCWLYIACCYNFAVTPFPWLDTILLAYFWVSALIWTAKSMALFQDHLVSALIWTAKSMEQLLKIL